jgi:hypothetical protein
MSILNKISVSLTDSEWRQVGTYANSLIQNDMAVGKFQNNQSNLQYRSEAYKRQKASGMMHQKYAQSLYNPETGKLMRGNKLKYGHMRTGGGQSYKTEKKVKGAKRLWGYYAAQIASTETSFVNMILTDKLRKSLHVVRTLGNGVESGYEPGDKAEGKILGNRRFGREVLGLSDENIKKVKDFMTELIRKRIEGFNQQINIEVKF